MGALCLKERIRYSSLLIVVIGSQGSNRHRKASHALLSGGNIENDGGELGENSGIPQVWIYVLCDAIYLRAGIDKAEGQRRDFPNNAKSAFSCGAHFVEAERAETCCFIVQATCLSYCIRLS